MSIVGIRNAVSRQAFRSGLSPDWVTMIDVSRHQGTIDFAKMGATGVQLLVLRVSHGSTEDSMVRVFYRDALAAGFQSWQIGFYSFINPKRGSATKTARDNANLIFSITGRTDVCYMLDIENYRDESPNVGYQPIKGWEFGRYIWDHRNVFLGTMPGARVIAYSNRAYWNGPDGPQDDATASQFEWIVPRYPYYSNAAYLRAGYPPAPHQWDEYAFKAASGPYPPRGANGWQGWQFSAGYNRQGPTYGCQSTDLDLNILRAEAAARWFVDPNTPPAFTQDSTQEEDDMGYDYRFTTNTQTGQFGMPGGDLLSPAQVAALSAEVPTMVGLRDVNGIKTPIWEMRQKVPKVLGTTPDEYARWDELMAAWEARQVAPTAGAPGEIPRKWKLSGVFNPLNWSFSGAIEDDSPQ